MKAAGFQSTHWAWRAQFSARNLNFSPVACQCFEYKHKLAQLVHHFCPTVMPETFLIDDLTWSNVLSDLADTYYCKDNHLLDKVDDLVWILKPALLNNGQHIKIYESLSQIEEHFLRPNHVGGPHVLQRYISNPDLLDNRKYSLRFFVVISQEAGAFLYHDGYLNVALKPYAPEDFSQLSAHLTNEHLHHHEASVIQLLTKDMPNAQLWYSQVRDIAQLVTKSLEHAFPNAYGMKRERTFAIFGFDFMMDSRQKMSLLEINHGPCFPIEDTHPLQKSLYKPFWEAVLQQFVNPIVRKQPINSKGQSGFTSLRV